VSASANTGTNTTLEMTGWTVLSGYQWIETKKDSFEPVFEFRYFGMRANTDWNLSASITGPGPGETFQPIASLNTKRVDRAFFRI
jgi:hypothetical protein